MGRNYLHPNQSAKKRHKRTNQADDDFPAAYEAALAAGMMLRKHSQVHYSIKYGPDQCWHLNLYPSNLRLYSDHHHEGPFLDLGGKGLDDPWTLFDIVEACARSWDV